VKKRKLSIFKALLYNINKAIEANNLKEWPLEEIVLTQFYKFLLLFSKVVADWHPLHWPGIDHEVHLIDDVTPSWGPLYSISNAELVDQKE